VFGPVAPLVRFSTDEEAIKMCNESEFGACFTLLSFFPLDFFFYNNINFPRSFLDLCEWEPWYHRTPYELPLHTNVLPIGINPNAAMEQV